MSEHYPSEIADKNEAINDDEIDLVELVAILYRRRWLMAGVFVFIIGLAVAYCFIATPKYEITAQISPGITGYDEAGQPVKAWSAKDIQNWFNRSGYLEILEPVFRNSGERLEIEASNTRESDVVNLSFDWPDKNQGKELIQKSIDFLAQRGIRSIQHLNGSRQAFLNKIFQYGKDKEQILIERDRLKDEVQKAQQKLAVDKETKEYEILKLEKELEQIPLDRMRVDNQIAKSNSKLGVLKTQISSIQKNKNLAKDAVQKIKDRIDGVNRNTEELMQLQKNSFTANSDKLALLMYSNIVQQNISFAISLQSRVEALEKEINQYIDEESVKNSELDDIKLEIQNLEIKRDKELAMKEDEIKKNTSKLKAELEKIKKDAEINIEELRVKALQELTIKADKLQENIASDKTRLATLNPLEVNQDPFVSYEPSKPEKSKIVLLSIVLAVFLAIICAFIAEFISKGKDRIIGS